jgi:hypothetical protein
MRKLMAVAAAIVILAAIIGYQWSKNDGFQALLDHTLNAQGIIVYGQVIDQNGSPVENAKIHGATLSYSGAGGGSEIHTTETDAQGRFKFSRLKGARFGLKIEKEGYLYDPSLYVTWWDHYVPDPKHPAIFAVYRLRGGRPMSHRIFRILLPYNGELTPVDFAHEVPIQNASDLSVRLTRNPLVLPPGKPFSWTFTMTTVKGGGIQEIHDTYPLEAPAAGYTSTIEYSGPDKLDSTQTKSFYYRSPDGKYSRFTILLDAHFETSPGYLHFDLYTDLVGSRNLEIDPKMLVL